MIREGLQRDLAVMRALPASPFDEASAKLTTHSLVRYKISVTPFRSPTLPAFHHR